MIYKFKKIINSRFDGKKESVGYIKNIPSSAVFYNIYVGESESWYIGVPVEDFVDVLEIDWRGKECSQFDAIYLGDYVFLYLDNIIAFGWPDVGKQVFEEIFLSIFDNIYFYEYDRRPVKRSYINFETLDSGYATYYFPLSNEERYYEPEYKRGDIMQAYKLKNLTIDGRLDVVKLWMDNDSNSVSIERTSIDNDWDRMSRSYDTKDWSMEMSNDGTKYWSMFDEAMILLGGN